MFQLTQGIFFIHRQNVWWLALFDPLTIFTCGTQVLKHCRTPHPCPLPPKNGPKFQSKFSPPRCFIWKTTNVLFLGGFFSGKNILEYVSNFTSKRQMLKAPPIFLGPTFSRYYNKFGNSYFIFRTVMGLEVDSLECTGIRQDGRSWMLGTGNFPLFSGENLVPKKWDRERRPFENLYSAELQTYWIKHSKERTLFNLNSITT